MPLLIEVAALHRVFDVRVSVDNIERYGVVLFHRLDDVDVLGGLVVLGHFHRAARAGVGDFFDGADQSWPILSVATALLRDPNPVDGLVVVPVDLPLLTSQTLRPLVEYFIVSRPTAAFYGGFWLPAVFALNEAFMESCQRHDSVRGLLDSVGGRSIPPPDVVGLTNANTPAEWAALTRKNP